MMPVTTLSGAARMSVESARSHRGGRAEAARHGKQHKKPLAGWRRCGLRLSYQGLRHPQRQHAGW